MIDSSLKIMLWDKEIGRLSWDARRGVSFFEYNPAFLGGRLDPFPLVASVKSPASRRPIMGDRENEALPQTASFPYLPCLSFQGYLLGSLGLMVLGGWYYIYFSMKSFFWGSQGGIHG